MKYRRIVGVVLSVVGIILLYIGMNASHSLADRVSQAFSGRFTHATLWFIVAGIASTLLGLLMVQFGGRGKAGLVTPPDA